MHYFILSFTILFPFLIYPWGGDPYYTIPKAIYLILFLFIGWVVYLISRFRNNQTAFYYTRADIVLSIFLLLLILSTIFSVDSNLSLVGEKNRYEGLLAWIAYISFYFFASRLNNKHLTSTLSKCIFYPSFLVAIYAILQHYLLDFLPREQSKIGWTRSYAFFDNPNFFGTYIIICLFLGLGIFLISKNKKSIYISYFILCTVFIALIFSLTRSAWLGGIVGGILLFVYVLKFFKESLKRLLILLLTFVVLFIGINLLEDNSISQRAGSTLKDGMLLLEGDTTAGSHRMYIWVNAVKLIPNHFWLGSGIETFSLVFPHDDPKELEKHFGSENVKVDKAHNEYLHLAVTVGVPTLLSYLIFLAMILFQAVKIMWGRKDQLMNVVLIATVITYLAQAFFNISVITVAPFLWIMLGVLSQQTRIIATN